MSYFGIPVRNSLTIGLGSIVSVGGIPTLTDLVTSLFANNEQGAWYDPSDITTLFQDSAGATPVTALGQPVGRILDKSGRGNHAFVSMNSKRPIWQSSNGLFYLSFDGSTSALLTSSINFSATNQMTVVTGAETLSLQTGIICELGTISTNPGAFGLNNTSSLTTPNRTFGVRSQNAFIAQTPEVVPPVKAVYTANMNRSTPLLNIRFNGAACGSTSASQGTGNFANASFFIGARNQTSGFFTGNLYSLILRGATCSSAQIAALEQYANSKTKAY